VEGGAMLDPIFILQERPPCPKCYSPMMLTAVKSGPAGSYTRTFECVMCNYTETIITAVEKPKADRVDCR
jgi:hypothetical protein